MKTLSIQQPGASLVCAGIKDVENRTWKPAEVPGRILIHASSKKVTKNFFSSIPEYQSSFINNDITFGNLPELDTLPTSAIIGYVTVRGFEDDAMDDIWAAGPGIYKWKLEDAWLFDEPILNVKGKLNLFDYDLDENNLPPAHQVELADVDLNDAEDEVYIPCEKNTFEDIKAGNSNGIELFLTDYLFDLLCVENEFRMKPFKNVTIDCDGKYIRFELREDSGILNIPDPHDEERPFMIMYHDGTEGPWQVVQFMFGKKLDEGEFESLCGGMTITDPDKVISLQDKADTLTLNVCKKDFDKIKNGLKEYTVDIPHEERDKYCEIDEDDEIREIDDELQPIKYKAIKFVYKKESYTCKMDYARVQPKQYIDSENFTYIHNGKEYDLLQIIFELGEEII